MPNDLSGIKPKEVSLVDKPANKKEFLFFKSQKGGKMPEDTGDINVNGIPVTVLKKFIEDMKPSVEKIVSLTANLETLQNGEEGKDGEPSGDVSKEFASIKKSLDDLVEKCSNIEKNSKEKIMPDGKDNKDDVSETLTKTLEALNTKIDGIGDKIKKMEEDDVEKKKKNDKEVADKKKADDDADVKKKKDKKDDKDADKDVNVDSVIEKVEKVVLEKVEKALDVRAEKLVGLFQEAAKEEFKGLFESVEANKNELSKFKKALSGGETEEEEGGEDYVRNYGDVEREDVADVAHKDNPFHGMLGAITSRS